MRFATVDVSARTLDHRGLLDAWELCQRRQRDELAVALLELFSDLPGEACLRLPLGQRDSVLLSAYLKNFSASLDVRDECDSCGESIEFSLRIDDLLSSGRVAIPDQLSVEADDWRVECEPLNSIAMIRAQNEAKRGGDVRSTARLVLENLITNVEVEEEPRPIDSIPEHVLEQIAERCYAVDTLAEISVQPRCPECDHEWTSVINVTEFLEQRINSLAQRLLQQVHRLASYYGWDEDTVLALSPARRAAYLELTFTESTR